MILQVIFENFYDFHSAAFFARFPTFLAFPSEIFLNVLVSIKDSSKKHASLLQACRGGLGEAPYNIYIYIYSLGSRSTVCHKRSP